MNAMDQSASSDWNPNAQRSQDPVQRRTDPTQVKPQGKIVNVRDVPENVTLIWENGAETVLLGGLV
jgi:hypothetical protein